MARVALGLGVRELGKLAGVSQATVVRFEGSTPNMNKATIAAIQRALEAAGVEFTNGDEPGVKLKRRG
jgi:predicted transcriptional regulator